MATTVAFAQEGAAKYVVLITVDGMRPEMVTDPAMPCPTIKQLAMDGLCVERMYPVGPAATYPNHTALVTGAKPINNGIYYNSPFMGEHPYNWFADAITCETIWGAAKRAGLTTCSLLWPVSTGSKDIDINIPEFWSLERGVDNLQFLKDHSSPVGILDSLEHYATGELHPSTFNAGTRNREGRTGYMATYIFEEYRPHLTTIHFISTDIFQHSTGLESNETKMSLAAVDYGICQVIEGLTRAGMIDECAIIVCGDHGFVDIDRLIAPNVWLKEAGLLRDKEDWDAYFHGAGNTMFLYLKDEGDAQTLEKVRAKLASLPESLRELFRVVEPDELAQIGCDPKVAIAVEPIKGVGVATAFEGDDLQYKKKGTHGYLLPHDPTTLVASGAGVAKSTSLKEMNIIDVAPFVMSLLGVDFNAPDGILRPELLAKERLGIQCFTERQ